MAENDPLKRYLDAGIAFTQLTRAKAEEWVREWVAAGEVGRDQAQQRVDDLVERSRKNTEQLVDLVRKEITNQLQSLGLATKDDLAKLEDRLRAAMQAKPTASAKTASTKKAATKTAAGTAKKATKKTTSAPTEQASGGEAG